jgi:hypothetical protein
MKAGAAILPSGVKALRAIALGYHKKATLRLPMI